MKSLNHKNTKKGFTILEMIVVVAIIAILASIALTFYNSSKQKSRDSTREADMKEIRNALNLYVTSNQYYPACGTINDLNNPDSNTYIVIDGSGDCLSQALINANAMTAVPTDPLAGSVGSCGGAGSYVYCYASDGFNYILRYSLETDTITGKSQGWQSIVVRH